MNLGGRAMRYEIVRELGRGGMAVVHEAHDLSHERRAVAIKRLTPPDNARHAARVAELFEREYHVLAQLAHPRVVEVFDYGHDEAGAFYTMELLDGGDLRARAPVPWRELCALLVDVCSALSLLHSRRLVHRDLTPRNVRCTRDGKAKLIDFGAMCPFGSSRQLVGTPAFTAPEAINQQNLDARTDLYALGATAYYALTKRHAYPAKSFDGLRNAWRSRPLPPSRLVPEIPAALDALILSLLHLNPLARPSSAAEVIERLSALADLAVDEQLVARQAYLSTPTLVGRNQALLRVRKALARAGRGHGSALLVTGEAGVGRTRFVQACVLEGKLGGALTLQAEAADSGAGEWGAVRTLLHQLLESMPKPAADAITPHASVLSRAFPELIERVVDGAPEAPAFGSAQELRAATQAAVLDVLRAVAASKPLLVAFDDIQRIDAPSRALAALLAHETHERSLLVVATLDPDDMPDDVSALSLLAGAGAGLKLRELTLDETQALLESVFGQTSNVSVLAERLQGIAQGNPRSTMELAQHLLDNGTIEYRSGAFVIPEDLDTTDLPRSLSDALRTRADLLGKGARELGQAIALSEQPALRLDELVAISGRAREHVILELDDLVQHGVAISDGVHHGLSHPSWRAALLADLQDARATHLHERIAGMFERRGDAPFHVARHALSAGQPERALDTLLQFIATTSDTHRQEAATVAEFVRALPSDWVAICERALDLCDELGRPRRDRFELQSSLVAYATSTSMQVDDHLRAQLRQLEHDTGLDIYASLDAGLDAAARLGQALQAAQQRHEALAPEARVWSPIEAIQRLAQTTVLVIAAAARSYDRELLLAVPPLGPLTALSPALQLIELNRQSSLHVITGRTQRAREGYLEIVARLDSGEDTGLGPTIAAAMRLAIIYGIASIEVAAGVPSGVERAVEFEGDYLFETNAVRLRMMHALRQGDADGAERYRRKLELMRIRNNPPQLFDGAQIWLELLCHVTTQDLVRVMQVTVQTEAQAARMPGWQPCLLFARAQQHLIRRDSARALEQLEAALPLAPVGAHIAWAPIAAAYLLALIEQGRAQEAVERGREMLADAAREGVTSLDMHVRQALALALAEVGDHARAVEAIEQVIAAHDELGATGCLPGSAYEARARIAFAMGDAAAFERYAGLCARAYAAGRNPALTARYERLIHEAGAAGVGQASALSGAADYTRVEGDETLSRFATLLSACMGAEDRAREALRILIEHSDCNGGFLYTMQQGGPALVAQHGEPRPPADMEARARALISAEVDDDGELTATVDFETSNAESGTGSWLGADGDRFVSMLLGHTTEAGYAITGVAVMAVPASGVYRTPDRVLRALSRALLDAGDVQTVIAA